MAKWPSEQLGDLCEFKNGLWKGKKPPYVRAGVIRNTNFTKHGLLDDTNIAYLDVEEKQLASRKLSYGDIILEKSGGGPKQPVGRVIFFDKDEGEYSFSNFTSVIRIRDKDRLYFRFLHWFLHYLYLIGETESMQKHSTNIRNLQLKEYKCINVPLPNLTEQQDIVAALDESTAAIEAMVANMEKKLVCLTELKHSFLRKHLTGENYRRFGRQKHGSSRDTCNCRTSGHPR